MAATNLPPVPARRAEELCASYLVNTKTFYASSVYRHTEEVVALVEELGARAVRERLTTGTSTGTRNQQKAMVALAKAGTRWHATIGDMSDWQDAGAVNRQAMDHLADYYAPRVGGDLSRLLRSFGGVNEIDHPDNGPYWYRHARIMQTALWNEATSRRATRDIPVAGPSTRTDYTSARAALLGDLTAVSDLGALHYYNHGTSPTRGISDRLAISRTNFPEAREWVVAETGYNNSPQTNGNVTVPEWASATYVIRGICDFFRRHAVYGRFELLDDPDRIDSTSQTSINQSADIQAHFGLVAMTKGSVADATPDTWRKKPEFYVTKRFLSLLSDRGPRFTTSALPLTVFGGGRDLQQLLVQKRDGRHYVVLWRDVEVADPYPRATRLRIEPDDITVRFAPARPVAVYRPGMQNAPVATKSSTDRVVVPLAGDLAVVEIG